ncbi:transcriptional regulator [Pullulanibacillus camelliae]|uniref:Transcriptional regulator n=1 Tax=Pullulanibacillus camelliae TaxID=1707096 RepID=A0A8J2VDW6_9BACL|nr:helix-turn-helix transcriptional regulator [Pullulanibacillus camelliae]GGE26898.1 transcriptional regulator [Pullulanibacillus camelliae]
MSELGQLLKSLRGKRSLRQVAELTGLSHSYISDIEKGFRRGTHTPLKASPQTLKRLAKAYDYSYDELMKKAGYIEEHSIYSPIYRTLLSEVKEEFDNDPETIHFIESYLKAPKEKKKQVQEFLQSILKDSD